MPCKNHSQATVNAINSELRMRGINARVKLSYSGKLETVCAPPDMKEVLAIVDKHTEKVEGAHV